MDGWWILILTAQYNLDCVDDAIKSWPPNNIEACSMTGMFVG